MHADALSGADAGRRSRLRPAFTRARHRGKWVENDAVLRRQVLVDDVELVLIRSAPVLRARSCRASRTSIFLLAQPASGSCRDWSRVTRVEAAQRVVGAKLRGLRLRYRRERPSRNVPGPPAVVSPETPALAIWTRCAPLALRAPFSRGCGKCLGTAIQCNPPSGCRRKPQYERVCPSPQRAWATATATSKARLTATIQPHHLSWNGLKYLLSRSSFRLNAIKTLTCPAACRTIRGCYFVPHPFAAIIGASTTCQTSSFASTTCVSRTPAARRPVEILKACPLRLGADSP